MRDEVRRARDLLKMQTVALHEIAKRLNQSLLIPQASLSRVDADIAIMNALFKIVECNDTIFGMVEMLEDR
jgi:hypothetical protein